MNLEEIIRDIEEKRNFAKNTQIEEALNPEIANYYRGKCYAYEHVLDMLYQLARRPKK